MVNNTRVNHKLIKQALLIRRVEQRFLDLFSKGLLNGTVHTCVGQEFSALAFAGQLKKKDFVFSNHRCHGHYIAFTNDYRGLLAELMGKASGTCAGIGSSQHLCRDNFYSNGIQGGIVPVAAGYALANKLKKNGAIGVVYIGDGTLGEGAIYETMNIISKWEIPLLIVCENNFYAQSTPQDVNLAGDIQARAEAFGIRTWKGDTWNPDNLMNQAQESINYVRETGKPAFHLVETYRLNAHSKGDDDREPEEVDDYRQKDYLIRFEQEDQQYYKQYFDKIENEINRIVQELMEEHELALDKYYLPEKETHSIIQWTPVENTKKRQVELLNRFFKSVMAEDERTVFIGEDILSPYGGAFKVARDLSFNHPERVLSTPISEAAIVGISNGLALNGMKPFAEIMFGDFILLAMDQIVNHAAKFHHMFNLQVNCPLVVRTPMGGRRGYGPTHSQTLDKFLLGIDNTKLIALNTLIDPGKIYNAIMKEDHPVIVIENKKDYGKRVGAFKKENFIAEESDGKYPTVRVRPAVSSPEITIVVYGGMLEIGLEVMDKVFMELDFKPELICPTSIHPLDLTPILDSVRQTGLLFVLEEGSVAGSIGSEIIASVVENIDVPVRAKRIGALPVPIPSAKSLEDQVLPSADFVLQTIEKTLER